MNAPTIEAAAHTIKAAAQFEHDRLGDLRREEQNLRAELDTIDRRSAELRTLLAEKGREAQAQEQRVSKANELAQHANALEIALPTEQQPTPQQQNGLPPSVFDRVLSEHPEMQQTAPHPTVAEVTKPDPEPAGKLVAKGRGDRRG